LRIFVYQENWQQKPLDDTYTDFVVCTLPRTWIGQKKFAKTWLIQEIKLRMLHQTGVFKVESVMYQLEICNIV